MAAANQQPRKQQIKQRFEGAVLDQHGNETPITEQMIQQACEELERQAQVGLNSQNPRPANC